MVGERTRDYEVVMILSPEATEEEVATTVERVGSLITERGGTVSEPENWGVRRLAYPIQRFFEGKYVLTEFSMEAEHVLELELSLNATEIVLRHLVTKREEPKK